MSERRIARPHIGVPPTVERLDIPEFQRALDYVYRDLMALAQGFETVDNARREISVSNHRTRHENGGADEISVTGLSGLLADAQTPLAHGISSAYHTSTLTPGKMVKAAAVTGLPADATNTDAQVANAVTLAHAAVTLGAGSDAALALVGQQLTLADVLTPAEHTAIGDGAPHHAAVTLAVSADVLLGLTGQALSLDTQTANYVLAGPAAGAPAAPTFRALVTTDIPDLSGTYLPVGGTAANSDKVDGEHAADITTFARVQAALAAATGAVTFNSQNITTIGSISASGALTVNAINEYTLDAGVTIEGTLLRDSYVQTPDVYCSYYWDESANYGASIHSRMNLSPGGGVNFLVDGQTEDDTQGFEVDSVKSVLFRVSQAAEANVVPKHTHSNWPLVLALMGA